MTNSLMVKTLCENVLLCQTETSHALAVIKLGANF